MPFPSGAETVTVTKDYRRADGSFPTSISVQFRPSQRYVHITPGYTLEPVTVTVGPVNGQLSVVLFATVGFSYEVTERVDGVYRDPFSVLIPAGSGTVTLDSLAPVEPVIAQYTPVRTVEGIGPDVSGNIDLPPAQGADPAGTAQGLMDAHVAASDPHPIYLNQTEGDARYATPAALTAGLAGKENTGVAAGLVTAHEAAGDPHPQYLTAAEGNAAYATPSQVATKANKRVVMARTITSGDVPLNTAGSSWAPLAGSPTLTVPAAVGDLISVDFGSVMRTVASSNKYLDAAVVVSGGLRRMLGNGQTGTPVVVDSAYEGMALLYHTNFPAGGGSFRFPATANDIDGSGNVTVQFACRSVGSDNPVLCAGPANPLVWSMSNDGPVTVL